MGAVDVSAAAVVPRTVGDVAEALIVSRRDGTAILPAVADEDAALQTARQMLSADLHRLGKQFDAVKDLQDAFARKVAATPDDGSRRRGPSLSEEIQQPHNDGYAFGDYAPDRMFLHCTRPAEAGGDSFLVDGARLLAILADHDETRDLAEFAWAVPVDHSEPGYPQGGYAPLARRLPNGRVQVRHHLTISPIPERPGDAEMIARWSHYVHEARDTGSMFMAQAGDLICIDNYRVMHGRAGYTDPARKMESIWAWTSEAVAIPAGTLSIDEPDLASL
jgi:alpha-ketoglutarate-dependent taurine dioxygenase